MLEEGLEVALELHLAFHGLHLGEDARHFLQAHVVDGIGREVRRGVDPREIGVPGLSVRQLRPRGAGAGLAPVLVAHIRMQALVGGADLVLDEGPHLRGDPLAVCGRHALGERLDRTPENALLRILDHMGLQLGQHLVHDGDRVGHAT